MKKYLMTGIAVLALCAGFTSCSHDLDAPSQEDINKSEAQKIVNNYNEAFLKYVGGSIASDQTWGFGGYSTTATRGFNPNANEWADPAKNADGKAWNVVDALTPGQLNRVRAYFQNVREPQGIAINYTNFFVQQVYKGNTNAKTSTSTEKYRAANGSEYDATQMNYFMANGEHVNDFNNGTRDEKNVLDNGQTVNGGTTHKDRISLMVGSSTANFGFQQSGSSYYHNDRYVIISWSTIDTWASQNPTLLDAVDEPIGEKWNRAFVGLDFDMLPLSECESNNTFKISDWESQVKYIKNADGSYTEWDATQEYTYNNNTVKKLIQETNLFYAEDKINVSDGDMFEDVQLPGTGYAGKALKKSYLDNLISQGYRPTNSNLREWIKVGSCRDWYFSDWIVCVTEGLKVDTPTPDPDDVCIIAEDLSATTGTDFDFNDVVFTVHYDTESSATVTLYAAGGTLPLTVAGQEVHAKFGYPNPDEKGLYKMINTGAKADVNDVTPVTFTVSSQKSTRGKDIVIKVDKGAKNEQGVYISNWIELEATGGAPAAKVCVGVDFATGHKWCEERQSIKTVYPKFSQWVANTPTLVWWRN